MPVLLVPTESGEPIVIDKAVVFVGRHPDCDVVLNRSRKVSRKHCCFALVDDRLVVRDLGSMNGIIVNGKKVLGTHELAVGDEVLIGDAKYVLRVQQAVARKRRADAPKAGAGPGAEFPLDSDPADEYQETMIKAAALRRALSAVEQA